MYKIIEKIFSSNEGEDLVSAELSVTQAIIQVKRSNTHKAEVGPKPENGTKVKTGLAYELAKPTADVQLSEFKIVPNGGQNAVNLAKWQGIGTPGEGVNIIYEEF